MAKKNEKNEPVELESLPGLLVYPTGEIKYKDTLEPKKVGLVRGYQYISLGKRKFYVHKVVAEAFVPNPENRRVVIHKDGDLLNNHYTNLEWASRIDAQVHSYKISGKDPGYRFLTEADQKFILAQLKKGIPASILAKQFKVSEMKISRLRKGKRVL